MTTVRILRFVLRELTAAAEAVVRQGGIPRGTYQQNLDLAILKARNELDGLSNAGKSTPAADPIDDITPEEVMAQVMKLAEARAGRPDAAIPAALLCQSPEAREATRAIGAASVEAYREHERFLRRVRKGEEGPVNPRAFFFEG